MDNNQEKSHAPAENTVPPAQIQDNHKNTTSDVQKPASKDATQMGLKQSQETIKKQKQHPLMPMVKSFGGLSKQSIDKSIQQIKDLYRNQNNKSLSFGNQNHHQNQSIQKNTQNSQFQSAQSNQITKQSSLSNSLGQKQFSKTKSLSKAQAQISSQQVTEHSQNMPVQSAISQPPQQSISVSDLHRNSMIIDRFNRNRPDAPTYLKVVDGKMQDGQPDTERKKRKYVKQADKVNMVDHSIEGSHRSTKKGHLQTSGQKNLPYLKEQTDNINSINKLTQNSQNMMQRGFVSLQNQQIKSMPMKESMMQPKLTEPTPLYKQQMIKNKAMAPQQSQQQKYAYQINKNKERTFQGAKSLQKSPQIDQKRVIQKPFADQKYFQQDESQVYQSPLDINIPHSIVHQRNDARHIGHSINNSARSVGQRSLLYSQKQFNPEDQQTRDYPDFRNIKKIKSVTFEDEYISNKEVKNVQDQSEDEAPLQDEEGSLNSFDDFKYYMKFKESLFLDDSKPYPLSKDIRKEHDPRKDMIDHQQIISSGKMIKNDLICSGFNRFKGDIKGRTSTVSIQQQGSSQDKQDYIYKENLSLKQVNESILKTDEPKLISSKLSKRKTNDFILPDSQENFNSRALASPKPLSHISQGSQPPENTFDAFLDSYQSDQDEDYSEKEDLIQNKKYYAKDLVKPFEKNIPKAEIEYLLKDQGGQELIINKGIVGMLSPSYNGSPKSTGKDTFYQYQMNQPVGHEQSMNQNSLLGGNLYQIRSHNKNRMQAKEKERGNQTVNENNQGYSEYLQHSYNIQNSILMNNISDYNQQNRFLNGFLPIDNSIEPKVTRRQRQLQQNEELQEAQEIQNNHVVSKEKTFSFKDSYNGACGDTYTSNKIIQGPLESINQQQMLQQQKSHQAQRDPVHQQQPYIELNTTPRTHINHEHSLQKEAPQIQQSQQLQQHGQQQQPAQYQNNYYYNFNNSFAAGSLQGVTNGNRHTMMHSGEPGRAGEWQMANEQKDRKEVEVQTDKVRVKDIKEVSTSQEQSVDEGIKQCSQAIFNSLQRDGQDVPGQNHFNQQISGQGHIQQVQQLSSTQQSKRHQKQHKKQNAQSKKLLCQLTQLIRSVQESEITPLGKKSVSKKKISKKRLAQIGECQIQLIKRMREEGNHEFDNFHIDDSNRLQNQYDEDQEDIYQQNEIQGQNGQRLPVGHHFIDQYQQNNPNMSVAETWEENPLHTQFVSQQPLLISIGQLRHLIFQLDFYIQMIYQVFILVKGDKKREKSATSSPSLSTLNQQSFIQNLNSQDFQKIYENDIANCKQRTYKLLFQLIEHRDSAISMFASRLRLPSLPKYEVQFVSEWLQYANKQQYVYMNALDASYQPLKRQNMFKTQPQVSYFQAPLLQYAPQVIAFFQKQASSKCSCKQVNICLCMQKMQLEREMLFIRMRPFLRQYILPVEINNNLPDINEDEEIPFDHLIDPFDPYQDPYWVKQDNKVFKRIVKMSMSSTQKALLSQNRRKFNELDDSFLIGALDTLDRGYYCQDETVEKFEDTGSYLLQQPRKYSKQILNKYLTFKLYQGNELQIIRDNWLPKKEINEIKHRFKNMTCQRAGNNMLKRWKVLHYLPLRQGWMPQENFDALVKGENENEQEEVNQITYKKDTDTLFHFDEIKLLAKALCYFGIGVNKSLQINNKLFDMPPRWPLISRHFIPSRSPRFLKIEFQNILQHTEKLKQFSLMLLEIQNGINEVLPAQIPETILSLTKMRDFKPVIQGPLVIDMSNLTDQMVKEAKLISKKQEQEEEENGQGGWSKVIGKAIHDQ